MIERKFEEVYDVSDYEIMTDNGWKDVVKIGETIPYRIWILETENYQLKCADTHIVFDEEYNEVFVKDLEFGDKVITKDGIELVIKVTETDIEDNMYDLEVDSDTHTYFTGGIISHNTLWLCHSAAALVQQGYNVAYYTAEMAEEMIYKRLDANILDIQMNALTRNLDKANYLDKVKIYSEQPEKGRLFCKEYPTGFGTRDHILQNLEDLKFKEDFVPDVIVVDSVNIFGSCRLPASLIGNTYLYHKAVMEEFRAIGLEKRVAVITATQLNRETANKNVDKVDTTGTSDCVALNTLVEMKNGVKRIDELRVGDEIRGSEGFVKVLKIWPKKKKRKYRITTKSGKVLECSVDHKIMTENGLKCIKNGLVLRDKISSIDMMQFNDEIVEIVDLGYDEEMIDIGVDSEDHLFYASNILVKNSYGIPFVSDWMGAIMQPQEMYEAGRYLLKSIKTRFDEHLYKVNTIGVDRSHMRLFDVDDEDMPESVKDRMKFTDKKRAAVQTADDTTAFLFDEDFE